MFMTLELAKQLQCDCATLLQMENNRLQSALNEAHRRVNALGGYVDPDDKYGAGINDAITKALAIIEELGGSDPAVQQVGKRKAS